MIRFIFNLSVPIEARIDLPDQSLDGYLPTLYAFPFNFSLPLIEVIGN